MISTDARGKKASAPATGQNIVRGESLTSIAWKQFRKHQLARLSLTILAILYILAAFADFIAPYPERFINTSATFQPPNRIYMRDESGAFSRPFIYPMQKTIDRETFETVWEEDTSQKLYLDLLVRTSSPRDRYVPFPVNLIPPVLRESLGITPWASLHLFGLEDTSSRSRIYLWGSDDLGSDVFGKILFGARISLTIGILASIVAVIIGMTMGGIAGFFGGWIDEFIMRLIEALSAIPSLFLLLTLSAIFYPLNLSSSTSFLLVLLALSLIGWGGIARTVRGQILSIREREFALAAKSLGASNLRIIAAHLLPQTISFIIVYMSLDIPGYILAEAGLSFVGLGIQPPSTSWGLMLSTAQSFAGVNGLAERWWIFIPGLFIFISIITWNLLGDGLRDAFDPRARK